MTMLMTMMARMEDELNLDFLPFLSLNFICGKSATAPKTLYESPHLFCRVDLFVSPLLFCFFGIFLTRKKASLCSCSLSSDTL